MEDTGAWDGLALEELFSRGAVEVAPRLLGSSLSVTAAEGTVTVRITETEAYMGAVDPGSHAFRGPTDRNRVMFGPPLRLYVYFTYGMHWCANIVCGTEGAATAVLLRAGEVVEGFGLARSRRPAAKSDRDLARGPARLASALGLDGSHNGASVALPGMPGSVRWEPGGGPVTFLQGPRTGVSGVGGGPDYPWRYWIPGEPTVSPFRRGRNAPLGSAKN